MSIFLSVTWVTVVIAAYFTAVHLLKKFNLY